MEISRIPTFFSAPGPTGSAPLAEPGARPDRVELGASSGAGSNRPPEPYSSR